MVVRSILLAGLVTAALGAGAAHGQARDTVVTSGSVQIVEPAQLRQDTDLTVPTTLLPASGSKTAAATEGSYTVVGLGGEAFNVSTPGTVTLTRSGGTEEIQLHLQPSQTVGAFSGPVGQPSSAKIGVRGSLPVASDAKGGVYQGQYRVTVDFQ